MVSWYDLVLHNTGDFSLWQLMVVVLCSFVVCGEAIATHMFTFVGYIPRFRCFIPSCDEDRRHFEDYQEFAFALPDITDGCHYYHYEGLDNDNSSFCHPSYFNHDIVDVCREHVYDVHDYAWSFVMHADLADCNDDGIWNLAPLVSRAAFISSAYMMGSVIGGVVFGASSHWLGRRLTLLISILLTSTTMFLGAFVEKSFGSYSALRFASGIGSKGLFWLAIIYTLEACGLRSRSRTAVLMHIPYAIGQLLVGLFAYLIQDWRDLEMTLAILVFLLFAIYFLLPESPKWLVDKGRYKQAKKVLQRAATTNKKVIPKDLLEPEILNKIRMNGNDIKSLLGSGVVFKYSLMLLVNWFVAALCTYTLSFSSVNMPGNTYVNFSISALMEIPASLMVMMVMDRVGRKPLLVLSQVLAGLACLIGGLVTNPLGTSILSHLGKFGGSAAYTIVYVYTAELFPTDVRNTALGTFSSLARIGGAFAPIVASLSSTNHLSLIIIGSASLIGALSALFLPETLGQSFPETLEEVKSLWKMSKPWHKWLSSQDLKQQLAFEMEEKEREFRTVKPLPALVVPDITILPATPETERKQQDYYET